MSPTSSPVVAVIGGGPAGLMAADVLATAGVHVNVYDAKPSLGRKFLRAGVGGLNLTFDEPFEQFCARYYDRQADLQPWLQTFGPAQVREWAHSLGIDTFVGSSGKVFPVGMKAAPLLRAWVSRLKAHGVSFSLRHRWEGWSDDGTLQLMSPHGPLHIRPDATVLALGGGSWPRLGSDAAWVPWLVSKGVDVRPLKSANSGFDVAWSDWLHTRHAGANVKAVALSFLDAAGQKHSRRGEFVLTRHGIEGSLVYALSHALRTSLDISGTVTVQVDLLPDMTSQRLVDELARPRGARSFSSHLQSRLNLGGVKSALLHEVHRKPGELDPVRLAGLIKALPLVLRSARPLAEAISTAGGVPFEALDSNLMLNDLSGVFVAGEMLDWEAPTGGYLLTACLALGRGAGEGVLAFLKGRVPSVS